jgi:hypothetical protein
MFRLVTWWAKCLFIYIVVAIAAIRYSWVFALPVWQIAQRMHWTSMDRLSFIVSYFLPIFAIVGFIAGLIPFGRPARAIRDLFAAFSPAMAARLPPDPDPVAPILWAWLPVTIAFLVRFVTWKSSNSSVLDPRATTGRVARFFGTLNMQAPGMLDNKWVSDRFIYTGPMLFLIACAVAFLLRQRLTRKPSASYPSDLSQT